MPACAMSVVWREPTWSCHRQGPLLGRLARSAKVCFRRAGRRVRVELRPSLTGQQRPHRKVANSARPLAGASQGQNQRFANSLRLSEIREDGIHVTQLKSGGKVNVVIEWTDALRTAVAEARAIERPVASMYVICNRQGQRYTDSGFKSMWNRLQVAWHEAGGTRFHYHDLRARSVGKLKADGRQAKDITGHTTEATAERIYDRRTAKSGKAVE